MKILLTFIIGVFGCGCAYALDISGVVYDRGSGKPAQGVTVGIRELKVVTETDNRGAFVFTNVPKGFYQLTFTRSDYGHVIVPIRVKRSFYIEQKLTSVVYSAGTNVKSYTDDLKSDGEAAITRDDIKLYPMRGVGDSLHLLQSLPGIGGGYSLATVPIIRGTNPLFNKYYIDDVPVDYPYHYAGGFIPLFSSINEEALDSAAVIKGNAPIWTGDNLGNVIMVKSAEAEKGGVNGKIIFDPIVPLMPTFSCSIVPDENLSIVAVGRRSTADLLFDMNKMRFNLADYFLKASYALTDTHRMTVMGTGSQDRVFFNDLSTRSGYYANGLTWEYLARTNVFVKTVLSNQNMTQSLLNKKEPSTGSGARIKINPDQYRAFQMATLSLPVFSFRVGYEAVKYSGGCSGNASLAEIAGIKFYNGTSSNPNLSFPLEGKSLAGFAGIDGKYDALRYDAGVRYESYGPTDERAVSYNVNAGYMLNQNSSVYFKHGRYYAHPDIYYYLGNLDPDFKLAEARNFALGGNIIPFKDIFINTEIYYCRFNNLSPGTIFSVNDDLAKKGSQLHPFSDEKDGHTFGCELSGKGGWKGFEGWVSYSYSRSTRNNDSARGFSSDFDQTHLLRLVLSRSWSKWTTSLIWHMTSSLPYTPVSGYVYNGSSYTTNYGDRNSARYAMNKRLDVRGSYRTDNDTKISVECWNLLFFRNNAVTEKQNTGRSADSNNTTVKNDIPFFIWISMEKPL